MTTTAPAGRHYLRARLETKYDEAHVALRVECDSPEGALCRLVCTEGCEEYSSDHPHPLEDQGECNAVLFIEQGEVEMAYGGSPTDSLPLHDGAEVDVVWEGDYYAWKLAPGRYPSSAEGSSAEDAG